MSFELPDLNTVPAEKLLTELAERIPRVAPKWTEQNPSDPGITLLEMLVWIVEATAYQANCIPFEAYLCKVRFILGLAFSAERTRPYTVPATQGLDPRYEALQLRLQAAERDGSVDFEQLREAAFDFRSSPYLASTQSDIEALAKETNGYIDSGHLKGFEIDERVLGAHAKYIDGMAMLGLLVGDPKEAFLEYDNDDTRSALSFTASRSLPTLLLRTDGPVGQVSQVVQTVRDYVSPRALLGNPLSIRSAPCMFVTVRCTVRCAVRASTDEVAVGIAQAIIDWMQPYSPKPRASALSYGIVPTKAALLSVFTNVNGIHAVETLAIDTEPLPAGTGFAEGSAGLGVGPVQVRHFKGHRFGPGGVTILRSVSVTAKAFSS